MTNVWLDDLRTPPDGWLWFKTSQEIIDWMESRVAEGKDIGDTISFDHDLGGDDTSRRVVLWMCERDTWPANVRLHSANPVGLEWLGGMVERYAPSGTLLG